MVIIKPSFEYIPQNNILKHIELAGRVCYKSEKNINEDSAKKFINNICKSGHTSVLEHGSVEILTKDINDPLFLKIYNNKYTNKRKTIVDRCITNMRVIFENDQPLFNSIINNTEQIDYPNLIINTSNIKQRYTFRIICDRRIETELVRHRVNSFSIESTRYVNYKKRDLVFIDMKHHFKNKISNIFLWLSRMVCQFSYNSMIKLGEKPEIARSVLLSNNKAEIIMTAYIEDWKHFFNLRNAPAAHPQMREIANGMNRYFIINNMFEF